MTAATATESVKRRLVIDCEATVTGNYATYAEMPASYEADVAEIIAGDAYGNNIVNLYNPLNYIGTEGTANPT